MDLPADSVRFVKNMYCIHYRSFDIRITRYDMNADYHWFIMGQRVTGGRSSTIIQCLDEALNYVDSLFHNPKDVITLLENRIKARIEQLKDSNGTAA